MMYVNFSKAVSHFVYEHCVADVCQPAGYMLAAAAKHKRYVT